MGTQRLWTPAFKRGFAAWIDFQKQVEGFVPGLKLRPTSPAGYNMALLPETNANASTWCW